jgi:hypothetical protein
MENLKPFSMSRFATLWHCECEFKQDGNVVTLYEPLLYDEEIDSTWNAVWEDRSIRFYYVASNGKEKRKPHVTVNRHLMFSGSSCSPDILILIDGTCVELTTGQVRWREEKQRWYVVWVGYTHSRYALAVKEALGVYVSV